MLELEVISDSVNGKISSSTFLSLSLSRFFFLFSLGIAVASKQEVMKEYQANTSAA